jgi:hypothetical protein
METIYQASGSWKQAAAPILTFDKVDISPKLARRAKKGHYSLTKWTIHQEVVIIVNIYI